LSEVAFEDAPFQRAHWKVATGATAGYVSDGYTLGVVGIALAGAQTQLSLTPAWLGALGGASLVGLFLGALVSGSSLLGRGIRSGLRGWLPAPGHESGGVALDSGQQRGACVDLVAVAPGRARVAPVLSRIGAAAGTSLLPLCVTHFGIHVALDVCIATLLFGAVIAYRWAPETRHSYI
jgi:hypothetical protein